MLVCGWVYFQVFPNSWKRWEIWILEKPRLYFQVFFAEKFENWDFCPLAIILGQMVRVSNMTCGAREEPRSSFTWILPWRNVIFPILILKCSFLLKKDFIALFHGWGSTASRIKWEPPWGGSLLFPIKLPEITGTHFLLTSEGQTTQIMKSNPKNGVLVVAKMLFPRVDGGFWLYYTSDSYKNIQTNIDCAFQFCSYSLVAELRKI